MIVFSQVCEFAKQPVINKSILSSMASKSIISLAGMLHAFYIIIEELITMTEAKGR